jgi:hypothetical protein
MAGGLKMISMQLLGGVLVALAGLAGAAVVIAAAIMAAAAVSKPGRPKPGQSPHGGIGRAMPMQPQPDTDDDRVLVLH